MTMSGWRMSARSMRNSMHRLPGVGVATAVVCVVAEMLAGEAKELRAHGLVE